MLAAPFATRSPLFPLKAEVLMVILVMFSPEKHPTIPFMSIPPLAVIELQRPPYLLRARFRQQLL